MILSAVCMMLHQNQRFWYRPPGASPYQQDVGAATLKTPPAWCHENAACKSWLSDVLMCLAATDVEVERQGPAAGALQITGVARAARDWIRELPPQLREGVMEQGHHIPGLILLCGTLANHFAPLESELQTRAMAELINFARLGSESINRC